MAADGVTKMEAQRWERIRTRVFAPMVAASLSFVVVQKKETNRTRSGTALEHLKQTTTRNIDNCLTGISALIEWCHLEEFYTRKRSKQYTLLTNPIVERITRSAANG